MYDAVPEAAKRVPGLKRDQVLAGVKTPALGGDLTRVKCKGERFPLGITVDAISGLAFTIDALPAEDIKALQEWIGPIARSVGANILGSSDADSENPVADEVDVQHQVCKAHVLRNTETLIERYQPLVAKDADVSLTTIGVSGDAGGSRLNASSVSWSRVDNGSRPLNWKPCTGAICRPRHRKKESTRV